MVDQSKEDISDCKGLRDVTMTIKLWPKWAKYHKNGFNFSCMQHIHAEFGFEIGQYYQGAHLWHSRIQGPMGVTMAPNFGTKVAINAYKYMSTRHSENVITYNRGFVVDQSKEDISDCKGLMDVAMATKFWPK